MYACDLSVFPYSPAANPTLTLAALSLRLSDHLVPHLIQRATCPSSVYNLLPTSVWVEMTKSRDNVQATGAADRVEIPSGKSDKWTRGHREMIKVYASTTSQTFNVQQVNPGVNALIVEDPPTE